MAKLSDLTLVGFGIGHPKPRTIETATTEDWERIWDDIERRVRRYSHFLISPMGRVEFFAMPKTERAEYYIWLISQ